MLVIVVGAFCCHEPRWSSQPFEEPELVVGPVRDRAGAGTGAESRCKRLRGLFTMFRVSESPLEGCVRQPEPFSQQAFSPSRPRIEEVG